VKFLFDTDALNSFRKSGLIIAKIRKEVPNIVKPGKLALKICMEIENRIQDLGGKPAFPVNIGINEVAAHYTSPPGDTLTIPQGSMVKVDFGVHVNGYVTDTAVTVFYEPKFDPMVKAADDALQNAIKAFRGGVKLSDIGRVIQATIGKYGFRPISNLTGHSIERYSIHAGKSVPNVPVLASAKANEGEVFAIEPFVTLSDAAGAVTNAFPAQIYRYIKSKGVRNDESKKVLDDIYNRFSTLPFAPRWLEDKFSRDTAQRAMADLTQNKCVSGYPVLVEETRRPVAQSEHTVLVERNGCRILTLE
jgi:methionyl aminopeptidase